MPAIYSNITRLQASEQAVSKGTIDYVKSQVVATILIQDIYKPIDTFDLYPNTVNIIPDQGYHPRGMVYSNVNNLMHMVSSGFNASSSPYYDNVFVAPVYEGVTRSFEEEDVTGVDLSSVPQFTCFKQWEPYVDNWRIPYTSKVFPIFATGDDQNGGYHDNSNYALLRLLDFDLPYVKCNILRGEMSSCAVVPEGFAYNSPQTIESMKEDFMYQYPLYNALEVIIATKSLLPSDTNQTPHGGCWLRKVFTISWKLKEFTEIPFSGMTEDTISRKYWYPSGLLPADSSGTNSDFTWERYANFAYDLTSVNTQNPNNEEYETPDSTWFQDYLYPPTHFYNDESPLEIIENDNAKTATIKINGITRRGTDSLDHKGFVAKGIARLI